MNAIVDVQGFKTDENQFIVKEIAVLCNNHLQTLLIKQPYPFYDLTTSEKRQVSWIERNRHIYWREGFVPYWQFKYYISDFLKDKNVYVKGLEKVQWIKEILPDNTVYNLEDKGCPSIMKLYAEYNESNLIFYCLYHSKICAQKNVICLSKWCTTNKIFL